MNSHEAPFVTALPVKVDTSCVEAANGHPPPVRRMEQRETGRGIEHQGMGMHRSMHYYRAEKLHSLSATLTCCKQHSRVGER